MNHFDFIKQKRDEYRKLKPIYSYSLKEWIFFNADGFNHLLFRGNREHRNIKEQIFKLSLLLFVHTIIKNSKKAIERRTHPLGKDIEYVAIDGYKNNKHIKVVLKRKGKNGKLFFWSVMRIK